MGLFVVHLVDATPLVAEAETEDAALDLVGRMAPDVVAFGVTAVPPGTFLCELRVADPEGDEQPDNPANVSDVGVSLEPFEELAAFLHACDALDAPAPGEAVTP